MNKSYPLSLPTELLFVILKELDFHSLLRLTEVCRGFHSLLKDSLLLRYETQLVAASMKDGSSSTCSTAARLNKLKAHQDAWNHLEWSEPLSYSLTTFRIWEIVGGLIALCMPEEHVVHLVRPPSVHRGISHQEWTIPFDVKAEDLSIDPSADLLVAITDPESVDTLNHKTLFRVYILSLETGRHHPKASQPEITVEVSSIGESWTFDIRILDQHVAISFSPEIDDTELIIWNWETGATIKRFAHVFSFAFLTDTLFMLGSVSHNLDENRVLAEVVIIDLYDKEVDGVGYCLRLPTPASELEIYLGIISESPPASKGCHPQLDVPFTTSLEDRLIVITYQLLNEQEEETCYALFVPLSVILYHVRHVRAEKGYLRWDQWGPQGTRLLLANFSDVWMCSVHGMKATVYDPLTETLRLFDFAKLGMKFDLEKGERRPEVEYLTEATVIESVFGKVPICTSLPGRVRTGKLPIKGIEAVMIAEDALVLVSEGTDVTLYVYSF